MAAHIIEDYLKCVAVLGVGFFILCTLTYGYVS